MCECLWRSMADYGSLWVFMVVYGSPWINMSIRVFMDVYLGEKGNLGKNRLLTVNKRFPWTTFLTALWRSFGSTFNLFIAHRWTTLFLFLWYPVRGYRWVTSIFNFSALWMQGLARYLFCSSLVPVVDVVPAPGEAKNHITTSPTGIREPRTNKPQTTSPAASFDRGTSNKKFKSTVKRPSKFS